MAFKPIEILINAKDNASSVFSSLQAKVAAVGAALLAYFTVDAFVGIVKGAGNLEQAMSRVQAATGATAQEMVLLRQAAEDAGANTQYTSTEAAGALENLAKAGLSATDAIGALPAVLNLAAAGDVDLGQASEFLTKAVTGMGLAFSESARVADVLALGANATNTSVTGLAQALSYAAPVATAAGVSLESTVAILGKMADGGIDASRSGTALANILAQFKDPASSFKIALNEAGITTNNFDAALRQLAASGPAGEKAIIAVGLNAGPALRSLLNQGMGALDELSTKLKTAEGSAAAAAKVMQDNLNGSLTGLSSAWDTVKNTLGTPVLPVLKDGVDQLANAFRNAVKDGTIQQFGESIATAFKTGIQFVRDFIAQVDFTAVIASIQNFANNANENFKKIAEYATNASNGVSTAWGVMSAGANVVLAAIYGIGAAFASIVSGIQAGSALLYDVMAKITFGDVSARYKAIADEIRISSAGMAGVATEFGNKASAAFSRVADGAETARSGWAGVTKAVDENAVATRSWQETVKQANAEQAKTVAAAAAAAAAIEKKTQADNAAKVAAYDHRAALEQLRAEYAALIAKGDLQGAALKLQEVNKALKETPPAAAGAGQAAADAAAKTAAAYKDLGITTDAELKAVATRAKASFDTLAASGTASARELAAGFKDAAEKAIAANNGIAPSWVEAGAAARGYTIEVDAAGKAMLKAANEGSKAMQENTAAIKDAADAAKYLAESYEKFILQQTLSSDLTSKQLDLLEKEAALVERREAFERKRQGVDKDGFSTGKSGNRFDVGGNLNTLTGIASFLQSAGVDDEATARKIAREFADEKGDIPYINNPGQRAYGGDTISVALLKAAEKYTFGGASGGGSGFGTGNTNTGPLPSSIPTPDTSTTVNINLNGSTQAVKTDAAGARVLQDVLSQLANARGTSSAR